MTANYYHRFEKTIGEMEEVGSVMTCNRWHSRHHYHSIQGVVKRVSEDTFLLMIKNEFGRYETDDSTDTYYLQLDKTNAAIKVLWYHTTNCVFTDVCLTADDESVQDLFRGYCVDMSDARKYDESDEVMYRQIREQFETAF